MTLKFDITSRNIKVASITLRRTLSGLLDLANAYCEQQLKRHCEQIIKRGITIDNSAILYAAAIKYEAKVRNYFTHILDTIG